MLTLKKCPICNNTIRLKETDRDFFMVQVFSCKNNKGHQFWRRINSEVLNYQPNISLIDFDYSYKRKWMFDGNKYDEIK